MNNQKTILLVEDDAVVASFQSMRLTKAGYKVLTAGNGKMAIEIVTNDGPINLILMDINLGKGMNGAETAKEILKNHDIPIVFLSSHTEKEIVNKISEITSFGYVVKDSGDAVLLASLEMAFKLYEANLKLQKSERQYRSLAENIPDVIVRFDKNFRYLFVNKKIETMTGKKIQDFIGKTNLEIGMPDHFVKICKESLSKVFKTGLPVKVEFSFPVDNEIEHFEARLIPEFSERGEVETVLSIVADITESKEILLENQERLKLVFEGGNLGFWDWDIETNKVKRNARWAEILGYTEDEISSTVSQWTDFIHPDDQERALKSIKNNLEGKTEFHQCEYRMKTKDGKWKWIYDSAKVVKHDKQGNPLRMSGTHTDITERKSYEIELAKQTYNLKERLKELNCLYNISNLIQNKDLSLEEIFTQIIYFIPPAWQYPEITCARIIFENKEYTTENFNKSKWKQSANIIINGKKVGFAEVFYSEEKPEEDEGPFMIEERKLINAIAEYIKIILEQKQADEIIKKLSLAVEQSPVTIVITDIHGNIEFVNPRFTQLTGYKAEDAMYMNPRILKTEQTPSETFKNLWDTIASGEIWEGEFYNKKKNGEIFIEHAIISPIKNKDGITTNYLAIKEDITERKKAEEKIRNLNDDLKNRAEELESLNKELESFSYSVSHDLRNPLNIINGFSKLLSQEYSEKLDEDGKYYTESIRKSAKRMNHLINDILKLSKTTKGKLHFQNINLSSLVDSITKDFQDLNADRKVEFIIEPDIIANADERLIKIVLENLIGNAWKYTNKKDNAKIEFGISDYNNKKVFFVKDNGAGFDMKKVDKLFAPFERLHEENDFEGSGIGLATVQRIIHRHGGMVWAEGKEGEGATFFFSL